jgi:hypothetical protein
MHHRNIAEFLNALLLAGMAAAQVDRPCRRRRLPEYLRRVPHIVRPNPGLAIGYRCKMSGGCGAATSARAVSSTPTPSTSPSPVPRTSTPTRARHFAEIKAFCMWRERGC